MSFIGKALRPLRAGDKKLAILDPAFDELPRLDVRSEAFENGGPMGPPYVDASGDFPPLHWSVVPEGTRSLALVVQDIDVPLPAPLVHAVAFGIAADASGLPARALPRAGSAQVPAPNLSLGRGFAGEAYGPPTPIPGHGPHRYVYQVFALDYVPAFDAAPNEHELLSAIRGHVLACGEVIGTHEA
jgi:hypothetical protein